MIEKMSPIILRSKATNLALFYDYKFTALQYHKTLNIKYLNLIQSTPDLF